MTPTNALAISQEALADGAPHRQKRTRSSRRANRRAFYSQLQDGQIITVARQYPDGQIITYQARVIRQRDGRVHLEPTGQTQFKAPFIPSQDTAVPGYPGWFVISGIRVHLLVSIRSCLISLMKMAPAMD